MTEHVWTKTEYMGKYIWACKNCKYTTLVPSYTISAFRGIVNRGIKNNKKIPETCEEFLASQIIEA